MTPDMGRRSFLKTALLAMGAVPLGGVLPPPEQERPQILPAESIDVTPGNPMTAAISLNSGQSLRFEGYVDNIKVTISTQGGSMDIHLKRWPVWKMHMSPERRLTYEPMEMGDLEFTQQFNIRQILDPSIYPWEEVTP